MWRDYFYYTRNDRRGLIVLLAIIIIIGILTALLHHIGKPEQADQIDQPLTEYESFKATLRARDSMERQENRQPHIYGSTNRTNTANTTTLSHFNPNTDDSATLVHAGLPAYVARNIIRYRNKGGKFRKREDLAKIYGMDETIYKHIAEYIVITNEQKEVEKNYPAQNTTHTEKLAEGTVIDINTADTTTLMKIPGIGKGYSAMIVSYRNRLGGFVTTQQLKEIEGLPHELIRWFSVSKEFSPRKININKASLERLRSHPYMNFYRAKAITEYRRKYGKFKSIDQIGFLEDFDHETMEKLKPYLEL